MFHIYVPRVVVEWGLEGDLKGLESHRAEQTVEIMSQCVPHICKGFLQKDPNSTKSGNCCLQNSYQKTWNFQLSIVTIVTSGKLT
jgi:hypothetical protein